MEDKGDIVDIEPPKPGRSSHLIIIHCISIHHYDCYSSTFQTSIAHFTYIIK